MTKDREFKARVRDRMAKTGESYAAARAQLDERGAAPLPPVISVRPVLRVGSWDEARPHYVDWLGFSIDWEWRATPHSDAVVAIKRDGLEMMLIENDPNPGHSWTSVNVVDLHALAREWNHRDPNSAIIETGHPYDIPTIVTTDPVGNEIHWAEPVTATEEHARAARADQSRTIIQEALDAGDPLPSPDALVAAVGRPLGVALEVLNEYPEYGDATRPE